MAVQRRLGEVGHDDGMVIGAGGLQEQPPQQGLVRVGQLDELRRGGQVEQPLQQRLHADAEHGAERAAARRPQGVDRAPPCISALLNRPTASATRKLLQSAMHQAREQRGGAQHAAG